MQLTQSSEAGAVMHCQEYARAEAMVADASTAVPRALDDIEEVAFAAEDSRDASVGAWDALAAADIDTSLARTAGGIVASSDPCVAAGSKAGSHDAAYAAA
jgi:hypothetical protein